jgi:uncharacterized protein (DUF2236 family)
MSISGVTDPAPPSASLLDEPIPAAVIDAIANPMAIGSAAANVIMQLALLPVGRGVAESTVESGRVDLHPFKRARTTLSYLVVAMLGSAADREFIRREINRQHAQVRSAPGGAVAYNAFDADLQLWVAACLYRGFEMAYTMLYASADDGVMDALYRHSARLATTLQVRPDRWPPDRDAFEAYWAAMAARIEMDAVTRSYLLKLAGLEFLPAPVPRLLGPLHRWITAGYLPPAFRAELGLPWSDSSQRVFEAMTRCNGVAMRLTPRPLRLLPWNLYLRDVRRRRRTGRAFV